MLKPAVLIQQNLIYTKYLLLNMYCKYCGKQTKEGNKFCDYCGKSLLINTPLKRKSKLGNRILKAIIASVVMLVIAITLFFYLNDYTSENYSATSILDEIYPSLQPVGYFDDPEIFDSEEISMEEWLSHIQYHKIEGAESMYDESKSQFPRQRDILSSVVKIVCEDSDYFYYGSGTNFDAAGYVLTNLHVVEDMDDRCIVGFPDAESGLIMEVYWATPIIDKDNITGHDLAYLSIEEPVFDEDKNIYGYYDKVSDSSFPYFEITEDCSNAPIQLGDGLFIAGYPPLSGWALTITDGLVSSLYSQNNYIITSAKIVSGNSGGLAVDELGCYIGVPTAVYYEEGDEYLGEIIDAEFVDEFDKAVEDDIDDYLNSQEELSAIIG